MVTLDRWLGARPAPHPVPSWADSGAMALTGDPRGPVWDAEGPLASRLAALGTSIAALAARRGCSLSVPACALLGERAALGGLGRQGSRSVGGLAEMVECADGWVAVNLARPEDLELMPALVEQPVEGWSELVAAFAGRETAALEERSGDLGLPLAVVPRRPPRVESPATITDGPHHARQGPPLVVELASLWAGPLCGDLLGRAGARVVKVETRQRPDGARRGNTEFFRTVNGGKEMVVIDLDRDLDRMLLTRLLEAADVVVDGSRPRVMQQWGVDVDGHVAEGTVWVSITGYGREGGAGRRVAFGDDAAVAGGLVVPGSPPRFVADAVADPIAGLCAALAALVCLDEERGALVSVPLRDAAAWAVEGTIWRRVDPAEAAPPRARASRARAGGLGAHTESVRAEFSR